MTVQGDTLRDKRPAYYSIYKSDFLLLCGIAAKQRPYAIAAYNVLAFHANSATDTAFPSYATIARESGMSRRMAVASVALLVGAGLVTVMHRLDEKGDPTSNLYTLVSPVVHTMHRVGQEMPEGGAHDALGVVHTMHPNNPKRGQEELEEEFVFEARARGGVPVASAGEPVGAPGADEGRSRTPNFVHAFEHSQKQRQGKRR